MEYSTYGVCHCNFACIYEKGIITLRESLIDDDIKTGTAVYEIRRTWSHSRDI